MRKTILLLLFASAMAVQAQNGFSLQDGAQAIKYNPMIFGHFIGHFDNQVYWGHLWP